MAFDLTIDNHLLAYFDEIIHNSPENVFTIFVCKGEPSEACVAGWTATLIPTDTANEMIGNGDAVFKVVESRNILIYPAASQTELVGGHIAWGNTPPQLVDRKGNA